LFNSENQQLINAFIVATSADGAQVQVTLGGGHICSWLTPDGIERLSSSPLNNLRSDIATRGGISVIFPQFASAGPSPKHGFVRLRQWSFLKSSQQVDCGGLIRFGLSESEESRKIFRMPSRWSYASSSPERTLILNWS